MVDVGDSVFVVHQTQLHGSFVRRFGDLGETGGEREKCFCMVGGKKMNSIQKGERDAREERG